MEERKEGIEYSISKTTIHIIHKNDERQEKLSLKIQNIQRKTTTRDH